MIQIYVSFDKASKKLMASAEAIRREQAEQITLETQPWPNMMPWPLPIIIRM
jgi:hypothetical protein